VLFADHYRGQADEADRTGHSRASLREGRQWAPDTAQADGNALEHAPQPVVIDAKSLLS
jgi:hypothetical protein